MLQGKRLSIVLAALVLSVSTTPADASLILDKFTGALTLKDTLGNIINTLSPAEKFITGPLPQFQLLQETGRLHVATFLPSASAMTTTLTLQYQLFSNPGPFAEATWIFTNFFGPGMTPANITSVTTNGTFPTGKEVFPVVSPDMDMIKIVLPSGFSGEIAEWGFVISADAASAAPEPGTLLLLGAGLLGLSRMRRRH